MLKLMTVLTCACVAPVISGSAVAQTITGIVRDADIRTPVAGAVVMLLDSAGAVVKRTLTNSSGSFSLLRLPQTPAVRVVKIGYAAVNLALRDVGVGSVELSMSRIPFTLQAVFVAGKSTCGNSSTAKAALSLWARANAGLLAAIVAREAKPARVSVLSYARQLEPLSRRVTEQRSRVAVGSSRQPIVAALPPSDLASAGYMRATPNGQSYYAPDADVMFDDSFAGEHCFGVESGKGNFSGQVGLTFTPRASRSRLVDVEGTLWLDSTASKLLALEYRYTGVSTAAADAGAGGMLRFQTMPNGVVFISEWKIVLPLFRTLPGAGSLPAVPLLSGISEQGGIVMAADWEDSNWIGGHGTIAGKVLERGGGKVIRGVPVSLIGASATASDDSGRFTFISLPPGRYRVGVEDTSLSQFVAPRAQDREVFVTARDTTHVVFDVSSRTTVLAELCQGDTGTVVLGRLDDGVNDIGEGLTIKGRWLTSFSMTNADARWAETVVNLDKKGRFHFCGVPRTGTAVQIRAYAGATPIADTTLAGHADRGAPVRVAEWRIRRGILSLGAKAQMASFSGRVLRPDRTPIPGAEVWLVPTDIRAQTDSAGQFRLDGIYQGRQLVQIRRLGYLALRDTITLRSGDSTVREWVLTSQATAIEGMTVRGDSAHPGLATADRRAVDIRKTGFGRFMNETALAKTGLSSVAEVIGTMPSFRKVSACGQSLIANRRSARAPGGRGGGEGGVTRTCAPPGCYPQVWVDGIRIFAPGGNTPPPNFDDYSFQILYAIETYSSPAETPGELNGTGAACGTIAIWTKR